MKILVIGETGQLARQLQRLLPDAEFWGRDHLDWDSPSNLDERLQSAAPDIIVNTTAYTAVDKAQSEPQAAWAANAEGPRLLSAAASKLGTRLIHISTDYVFDGQSTSDYTESDPTRPINVYGATKLAGELAVSTMCPNHIIIRTSWVFSDSGTNFVLTMLRLAAEREALSVVSDQIGRPTYAGDLAEAIVQVCRNATITPGTYHLAGGEDCSWYDFAMEIFDQALERQLIKRIPDLTAIPTKDYPTPAARPMRCVMAPSSALTDLLEKPPNWIDGLSSVLDHLAAQKLNQAS